MPFVKGDPRINRKGRPKSFDALRKLAQLIAIEQHPDVQQWTVAEGILRGWATSHDRQAQRDFLEIAYGKVPLPIENDISGTLKVEIVYVEDWRDEAGQTAAAAFRAKDDSLAPGALQMGELRPALAQDDDGPAPDC